jgi:transposase
MRLPRILNQCHPIPGFVYGRASFVENGQIVLIPVRPRKRSTAICSGCHQPAPGYDQSPTPRRFEFIGFWGYLVFLVYCMRRVNCKQCGVLVEEVPWGMGKHTSTKVHMHFLGHWARKLSWKETAEEFRTSWDKVHDAVAYLVTWGLEHRVLGAIRAIGVDEIQRGKGHKYLTLVYQIDLGCTRLLWIGKERTVKTFKEFFAMIGPEVSAKIEFVCSDRWKPYLGVIRDKGSQALNILDRFHIGAKVNQALDDIRSAEARRMKADGYEPVLKKSRWCLLKRPANLTANQKVKLKDLVRYNLQSVRAYLLKEDFQQLWNYESTAWPAGIDGTADRGRRTARALHLARYQLPQTRGGSAARERTTFPVAFRKQHGRGVAHRHRRHNPGRQPGLLRDVRHDRAGDLQEAARGPGGPERCPASRGDREEERRRMRPRRTDVRKKGRKQVRRRRHLGFGTGRHTSLRHYPRRHRAEAGRGP